LTCKVMCERHKALRPADGTGRYILQDRKGVDVWDIYQVGGIVVSMLRQQAQVKH
jgi:hypothetical protein